MATSTIPAAIDGLIDRIAAESSLSGITIIDGQPTTELPPDYIAIGFADEAGEAIVGRQDPASLGHLRRSEVYTIACEISAWTGSTVMKTVRDRAFYILAGVENAVRADGTLHGSVIFGDFGEIQVAQVQTAQGAVVVIRFTIAVKITRI